jgi:hypothetical protein
MADRSQTGTLLDEEFVLFYKMLTKRDDVMRVFQDFSGDGQKLSAADLEDFLREEQLEAEDAAGHAARIIETYEPSDAGEGTSGKSCKTRKSCFYFIYVILFSCLKKCEKEIKKSI